ncbi:lipase [Coprinopsis sp. MPI-PUGE-AT-0042]|nr:lipase [Coprinopsis sp. MPI-PUGE-AT-0042]
MRFISLSLLFTALAQSVFAAPLLTTRQSGGIDQATFDQLERYAKFSSATYQLFGCPRPVKTTLVKEFDRSGTQGFITRDDSRKELIVAFRGSLSPVDFIVDLAIILKPLETVGVTAIGGAEAHTGFQFAYNAVADEVLDTVRKEMAARPDFKIVVTGHSLGGAVASMASLSIRAALPTTPMQLFTYDGVPTFILGEIGYRHFGTEYWNFKDAASPQTTKKCVGPEDPTCSDSIFSTFINPAHLLYFNQAMALNPLLCF